MLQISEDIEQVQETGFLSQEPTLAVQQIGEDTLLQVHPRGIRHILADKRGERVEGPAGPHDRSCDDEQTSSCRSVELGELDLEGQLNEYQDRKALGSTVLALSVGEVEVPPGRQRTPYLVRVLLLLPSKALLSLLIFFRPLVVKTRQCASSPSIQTTHLKSSACKRSLRLLHPLALLRCSTQVLTRVS